MTVVTPPTSVPHSGRPPEDDFDDLLRSYFRAEMPDPWPSFEAPAPRNGVLPFRRPQQPRRFNLWRSRLALAASILLLIGGALFLLGGSRMAPPDPLKLGPGSGQNVKPDDPIFAPGPVIPFDKDGAKGIRQDIPLDKLPMQ